MEAIFENGFLKPEFINPNYRGLVGWSCTFPSMFDYDTEDYQVMFTLISLNGNNKQLKEDYDCTGEDVVIPQFTPVDIPVGELVWIKLGGAKPTKKSKASDYWVLRQCDDLIRNGGVVPYLIAETAERAEELKDWSK